MIVREIERPASAFVALLREYRLRLPGTIRGNRFGPARAGMSQNVLARLARVDQVHIGRIARGVVAPSRDIVGALARALRLDDAETDRLLVAAGYWPWNIDGDDLDRALSAGRQIAALAAATNGSGEGGDRAE